MTRCVGDGWSHDFPIEDSVQAHCPTHGRRLFWKTEEPVEPPPPPDTVLEPTT